MLGLTRLKSSMVSGIGISVVKRAQEMMNVKMNDSFLSSFFLAVFCGILMFCAVEAYRKCCEDKNGCGAVFGVVMPVFVFIICGFNHCVADMAYYFISGCPLSAEAASYFAAAILGNGVGAITIPL